MVKLARAAVRNPCARKITEFARRARTVADRLALKPDSRLLETGPGSGYFSGEFTKRLPHGRLELFDLQPEMLAKARTKLASAGAANVGFTAGDGANLPFANEQFDCVVLISVLGEIPDQTACLRAIHRVLRPADHEYD